MRRERCHVTHQLIWILFVFLVCDTDSAAVVYTSQAYKYVVGLCTVLY